MFALPPDVRETIQDEMQDTWTDRSLTSPDEFRTLAKEIRRTAVATGVEGDCETISTALSVALEELDIPHSIVKGRFSTGDGVAEVSPHAWVVVVTGGEEQIVDPTAEQFATHEFPYDVGVFSPADGEYDKRYMELERRS